VGGRVCVVGSLNIDLVTEVANHPAPGETVRGAGLVRRPGGKGANQALAAAMAGASSRLVGRIGPDGVRYRQGLVDRGVDCSNVQVVPDQPTGHALIAVDRRGENTIIVVPGANAALTPDELPMDVLRSADVLLLQLEVPIPTVLRASRAAAEAGVRLVLNPSPWTALSTEILTLADPVIVNEHEADRLPVGVARSVCVTLGGAGARWEDTVVPAPMVDMVDTTGAGDAFAGTLAAALASHADRKLALRAAVAAGAHACTYAGAQDWTL
jgi:ribokinase